jgi:anthraniloyl-CoA monooxygenase
MEDAIELAQCFAETATVMDALKIFESRRRPVIEDYQAAAFDSMIWFENAASKINLSPYELALSVMMRSGRVTFEDLKKRDPEFVERYLQNNQ